MSEEHLIRQRLAKPLKAFPFLDIEFNEFGELFTLMENRNPNAHGHYTGGDMAYIANASVIVQCAAQGLFVQASGINVECIAKAEGDLLLAKCEVIHHGRKSIRTRTDVFVRKDGVDTLVAIGQINVSVISDQNQAKKMANEQAEKQESAVA